MSGDVFFFNTWYRGHNNARYAELLPRLDRVDARLLRFPRAVAPRFAAERAWRALRPVLEPRILHQLERRHPYSFVTDLAQLAHLSVPAVADVDDPHFTPEYAALVARSTAYVVTAESAARRFEELGVERPWHVIPQGVALDTANPQRVREIGGRRGRGSFVVGYVAAFLLLPGDRGGDNPLYDVSHLLELWDEIGARIPTARLWLVGMPSPRLRDRVASRDDVVLLGRVERGDVLAYVSNFDVALYPRAADQGIRAVKTAEYLGAGVPVVSYDYDVVADVRAAGAGLLVDSPRDFVAAVERLARDPELRTQLGDRARAAGAARDWRVLAERYASILDEHLPPLH